MQMFGRQNLIKGWKQASFSRATVVVFGRGWMGLFTIWALAALGVRNLVWVGKPVAAMRLFEDWVTSTTSSRVLEICDCVDRAQRFLGQLRVDFVLICTDETQSIDFAKSAGCPWVCGSTENGGQLSRGIESFGSSPVLELIVAAQMVDLVRETLSPLPDGLHPLDGVMRLQLPPVEPLGEVVLVGGGGIGAWAAVALMSLMTLARRAEDFHLLIIDRDKVEHSNRNRQVLFTRQDAIDARPKAEAAADSIRRQFQSAQVSGQVADILVDESLVFPDGRQPACIVSAVDNGESRLVLQRLAADADIPLIQGSTAVFGADCVCQLPGGASLDEQVHGALTAAAIREAGEGDRRGNCSADPSYVVPSMMAGGLVAMRTAQACRGESQLPPIRWRAGNIPVVDRVQR